MKASKSLDLELCFDQLYRENLRPLYRYLFSRVQDKDLAEDLCSQTFISAFESLARLEEPEKFKHWLFSIARNKANDHFRRQKRRPTLRLYDEMADLPGIAHSDATQGQDQRVFLQQLFALLRKSDQELLRLKFVAGLTFKEIATLLHSSENRIKKSYYRLLERLQAQVEN